MKIYLPGPGHDKGPMLKAHYEQLRQAGIKRIMSRELTVFLTEGMCVAGCTPGYPYRLRSLGDLRKDVEPDSMCPGRKKHILQASKAK